jgi:mannose-6-phosphate isomerase-like protein (cupin superfamily)
MIGVGFTTTEPRTQTRFEFIEVGRNANGDDFIVECRCPAGGGAWVLEHVHLSWEEQFEILSGEAEYKLDGRTMTARAGETVIMPAGLKHVHPWSAGDGDLIYRQHARFETPNEEAVDDVFGAFTTMFGLMREGKTNKKGLPKNPLQFAATLRTLVKHEGFDAAVPIPVQRALAATLGRFAEARGYRSSYPQYLG